MSGTNGALQLIETATARLCQSIGDLAGRLEQTLSTEANDDVTRSETVKAAQTISHRLKLMRAAWGPALEPIPLVHLTHLARGLPDDVAIDCSALPPDTVLCPLRGRILLNVLLLAADSLPAGGHILLAGAEADLFLRITGGRAAWPAGMATCFTNKTEALAALTDEHTLQMALTSLFAQAANMRLSLLLAPTASAEPAILRLGG